MPAGEYLEWMDFERLEPFGSWRDNWHAAMNATLLANAHRDPKRSPIRMDEFMYRDPETVQDQRDMEMLAGLRARRKKAHG